MGSGSRRGWAQLAPEWTLAVSTIRIGGHRIQHHEHQVILRQPLAHVHRHQQRLITLREQEVLRHIVISSTGAATTKARRLCDRLNYPGPPDRSDGRTLIIRCAANSGMRAEPPVLEQISSVVVGGGTQNGRFAAPPSRHRLAQGTEWSACRA